MWKFIQNNKIKDIREEDTFNRAFYVGEIIEDKEHSVSDYMQVNGEYILTSSAEAIEQKQAEVRAVRNQYLKQYVDPKQLVLVWNSLTVDEQKEYTDYRQYLLDYPETEGWYEQNPLTFEEWKQVSELEQIVASGE